MQETAVAETSVFEQVQDAELRVAALKREVKELRAAVDAKEREVHGPKYVEEPELPNDPHRYCPMCGTNKGTAFVNGVCSSCYRNSRKNVKSCRACGLTKESRFTKGMCSKCYWHDSRMLKKSTTPRPPRDDAVAEAKEQEERERALLAVAEGDSGGGGGGGGDSPDGQPPLKRSRRTRTRPKHMQFDDGGEWSPSPYPVRRTHAKQRRAKCSECGTRPRKDALIQGLCDACWEHLQPRRYLCRQCQTTKVDRFIAALCSACRGQGPCTVGEDGPEDLELYQRQYEEFKNAEGGE